MNEIRPWNELGRELVYSQHSRKIEKVTFELPNGSKSDFYIKADGIASCIVGLSTEDKIILVKQFRPGPKQILDELPGGYVDPNENPQEAAQREFMEETGYEGDFEFVGTCLDDAYSTMNRYCYVAKNCRKVSEPQHTATEQTEVVLVEVDEFRNRLRGGQLTDVEIGYMALDYLNLL